MKTRFIAGLALLLGCATGATAAEVNLYSYRKPQLIQPLLDAFTETTAIRVNAVFAKEGMLERLRGEGANTSADLVFTADIGRLLDLKKAGLTRAVDSAKLERGLPARVRDPENHWFGLTARARIFAVAADRVATAPASYEELAAPEWRGRICTRSGKHRYNIALFASVIVAHGETAAENWLRGVKKNLARKPQGNDRAQVKAVAAGECDVAVLNHYYLHKMAQDPKQKAWAEAVRAVFPNQNDRGTHMNISGMAMTRYAPNPENARRLMEFLASDRAQKMYADLNGEYPVNEKIVLPAALQSLGKFKRDTAALARVAQYRAAAAKMADRVGYND